MDSIVIAAGTGILGAVVGYLLHEWRDRRSRGLALRSDSGRHLKQFTEADYVRLSKQVAGGLRDSILGPISVLRREISDMAELLGRIDVALRDAAGRAAADRELTRQRQELSETTRQELRAEIMGLRKGIEALTKAAGVIMGAVERVEKLWA